MNTDCENQCWRSYHEGAIVSFLVEKSGLKEEKCCCNDFWSCKETCKDCLQARKTLRKELDSFLSSSFPREIDGHQLTFLSVSEDPFVNITRSIGTYPNSDHYPSSIFYERAYFGEYKSQASVLKHIMIILEHENPRGRDYCVHKFLDQIDYEVLVEMKQMETLVELASLFLHKKGIRYFHFEEVLKFPKRRLYEELSHHDAVVILAMKAVIDYRRTTPGYMDERLIR